MAKFVRDTVSDSDMKLLALATLGDVARNKNYLICVALPKVANASKW